MQAVSRPPNRLLQALPAAEFQSFSPHLETVELAKGAALTEAGAPLQYVYLPHSGVVSMMVSLSEGQTVEVAMVGRDSLVGASAAFDAGPALTDAIVVVPGTASVLKAEDLRAATDRSSVLRKLLARHEQALLVQAQQSAACNASHSVEVAVVAAAVARAGFVRQRRPAADPGIPRTNDRRAAQRGFDRGARIPAGRACQLQPGAHRNPGYRRLTEDVLRVLRGGPGAMRAAAEHDWLAKPAHSRREIRLQAGHHMRLFVNFSCQRSMARSLCIFDCIYCIFQVPGTQRPALTRKAGDCFGFSPSFTEWIFVVADRRRF